MEDERGMAPTERGPTPAHLALARPRHQGHPPPTPAGEQGRTAAEALQETARRLREQGNEPASRAIEVAAGRIERAGGWLRESDGDAILRDAEAFARRNPLAVAAAALAVGGFAASR